LGKRSPVHPRLAAIYQDLLLGLPQLPRLQLGNSKVLSFLRAWHYLEGAGVRGDYLEFGVYEGLGFRLGMRTARKALPRDMPDRPRFFAFDSFQGLPATDAARDAHVFAEGDYVTTRGTFELYTRSAARHWETFVIEGLFSESLAPDLYERHDLRRAAFVSIDCDLYVSTRDALRFVTPLLQTGTILYFDDWYASSGDMRLGEAGACRDWLTEHPGLELIDYGHVGTMGKLFISNR